MAVKIENNECQDRDGRCIHNGTVVCRECQVMTGNVKLKNLYESGKSRNPRRRKNE